jgi:hypothetical protein
MAENLGQFSGNASDPRPHQDGKIEGTKSGSPVTVNVEWLVDTGAEVCAISNSNANQFDLVSAAGSASATTGGGGIVMMSGVSTVFEMFDANNNPQQVKCSHKIGVKPNNQGSEILGMDRIAYVSAVVEWDPTSRKGRLRIR